MQLRRIAARFVIVRYVKSHGGGGIQPRAGSSRSMTALCICFVAFTRSRETGTQINQLNSMAAAIEAERNIAAEVQKRIRRGPSHCYRMEYDATGVVHGLSAASQSARPSTNGEIPAKEHPVSRGETIDLHGIQLMSFKDDREGLPIGLQDPSLRPQGLRPMLAMTCAHSTSSKPKASVIVGNGIGQSVCLAVNGLFCTFVASRTYRPLLF